MYVTTASEMRELDRATIEDIGVPGVVLMENAGRHAAAVILDALDGRSPAAISILCGSGNNGGDGYVIARWLHSAGHLPTVYLCTERDRVKGDAATHLGVLERLGQPIVHIGREHDLQDHLDAIGASDVIVDALLGTGLEREVQGLYRAVIEAVAGTSPDSLRVAIDIPSGVHADTGQVLGIAFHADLTITFGCLKHGLVHHPGSAYAGEVHVADIGIPQQVIASREPRAVLLQGSDLAARLPARPAHGHKGTFGHVLVLAGSPGKSGAALLAAQGALRSGAGLVTVGTDATCQARLEGRVPELMIEAFRETSDDEDGSARVQALLGGKSVVCAGPGLGATRATAGLVTALIEGYEGRLVLDADALNVAAGRLEALRRARGPVVLTPHPGELARLLGTTAVEVNADRPSAAREIACAFNVFVVLKGAHTVIASPSGRLAICPSGNPGMASGGTGDVLAGMIAGLLAGTFEVELAVHLAVYLHGLAGDLAADAGSEEGLTAGALLDHVPAAFRALRARA